MSLLILNYMHSTLGNRTTLALDDIDDYTTSMETEIKNLL